MNITNEKEWAAASGLLPMHLDKTNSNRRFIMLDGGYYDFCLDLTCVSKEMKDCTSDAWSSNTKNYVLLSDNSVTVFNWLKNEPSILPIEIVRNKFNQFVEILNKNSYRTSDDVMPFILSLFRSMRNQTLEKKEPLEALNLLYKLLISLEEEHIDATVCQKWGVNNVFQPSGFDNLVEILKKGSRNIRPNLDLILRHSSGVLFQEAHREALSFDYQYNLFGEMNSNIALKEPNLYSSIHYTPQYLARSIVERTLDSINLNTAVIRILDPACGSGAFLLEVLNQLRERGFNGKVEIDGLDCSPIAVSTTNFLLGYVQRSQWSVDNLSFAIRQVKDSLEEAWGQKYDLILMNPPFLSMELIKNKEEKDAVYQVLSDLGIKKRPNQASAFLYKAVQALNKGGALGIVLPSSILIMEQYTPLRNAIREQAELNVIGRLGNYVFEDALTDVSFVIVRKGDNHSYIPETIWCKNNMSVAYEALKEWRKMKYNNRNVTIKNDFNIFIPSRFPIVQQTWKTVSFQDDIFYKNLEKWTLLGKLVPIHHVFDIKQGILKGYKDAFVIKEVDYKRMGTKEKKLFRPLASAETIENGHIKAGCYIWYPYNSNGLIISSEEELDRFTQSKNLLVPYKQKLLARKGNMKWWELTRERGWLHNPKMYLMSKRFGNSSSFAINESDYVIEEGNAFFFSNSKHLDDDYYFYLSVFSSHLFERLLSIYAKPLLSGYDLGKINIKDIPVPEIFDSFRKTPEYKTLVQIGKEYAAGKEYLKKSIDTIVNQLYPYEKESISL